MVVPLRRRAAFYSLLIATVFPLQAQARSQPHERLFVPILIYHHVKWLKPSDNAIERGLTISPVQLKTELDYLARNGYHPVSAARVVDYLRSGLSLPSKPVVLTFDDGYRDVFQTTYPLLRRYHATATFFIVPGFLDAPRYVTWWQVEEMSASGMDIEAHTMTHPDLTLVGSAQLWSEVSQSHLELERRLHRSVRIFAYPYGDYNPRVLAAVRRAGYLAAFTTHQGWWQERSNLLTLPRVYVDRDDTIPIFAGRLRADAQILAEDPT
jgi:peptidoglycan/xylan/chitin deacetylase (PgdA/CDA1 family)